MGTHVYILYSLCSHIDVFFFTPPLSHKSYFPAQRVREFNLLVPSIDPGVKSGRSSLVALRLWLISSG